MSCFKNNKLLLNLSIILLILSFNNVEALTIKNELPDDILNQLTQEKRSKLKSLTDLKDKFQNKLYKFNNLDEQLPRDSIKITRAEKKPGLISVKKAVDDVNHMFKLLKYGYSGYQYFGGDEKFIPVKKQIINTLDDRDIFNYITTKRFIKILKNELSFIQDLHFSIDNESVGNRYQYYMSYAYEFRKDENGFYTNLDEEKAYLKEIKGSKLDKLIKPSLNEEGEIIYRLGTVINNKVGKTVELKAKLQVGNKLIDKRIMLTRPQREYFQKKSPYNKYKNEGFTIIEHRTASANEANRDQLKRLAEEAKDLKDKKHLIIDLRGNSGGADTYASDWVENFTGVEPGEGIIESSLVTDTANRLLLNSFNQYYGLSYDELEPEYKKLFKKTESGWTNIKYHEYKVIENKTLIIVLIDNGVASAGESFVNYLNQMENVILIGTNTAGLLGFGNMGMCNLPNSNVQLSISKTISLPPDLTSREGRGYYPDFWIEPDKALTTAVSFINNYFKN